MGCREGVTQGSKLRRGRLAHTHLQVLQARLLGPVVVQRVNLVHVLDERARLLLRALALLPLPPPLLDVVHLAVLEHLGQHHLVRLGRRLGPLARLRLAPQRAFFKGLTGEWEGAA